MAKFTNQVCIAFGIVGVQKLEITENKKINLFNFFYFSNSDIINDTKKIKLNEYVENFKSINKI